MKISNVENKIISFIQKHINIIFFISVIILSFFIRMFFISYQSGDYNSFLEPWFYQIIDNGGLMSLNQEIGNYNVIYTFFLTIFTYIPISPLLSIKLFSIIFDYFLAIGCAFVVYDLFKHNKNRLVFVMLTFSVIIMLPTVILNSSAWAQCDSIYTAFVIFCLYYLLKDRYTIAFVFFALAFCFKLQAVFFLPLLILLYITKRKFSIINFLIIPACMVITSLPAIIAGRSIFNVLTIYLRQTGTYANLTMNYASVWNLLPDDYNLFKVVGVLFTLVLLGGFMYFIISKGYDLKGVTLIGAGLWIVYACVLFLPSMHDRYAYMADILSILYFVFRRKKIIIPIGINFISLMSYFPFLFGLTVFDYKILTIANLIIFGILTHDLLVKKKV